jgi:hypothetical protein
MAMPMTPRHGPDPVDACVAVDFRGLISSVDPPVSRSASARGDQLSKLTPQPDLLLIGLAGELCQDLAIGPAGIEQPEGRGPQEVRVLDRSACRTRPLPGPVPLPDGRRSISRTGAPVRAS